MTTLTRPSLPGQPASPAEQQMIAKLERIDALYRLTGLARNSIFVERDSLTADLQEFVMSCSGTMVMVPWFSLMLQSRLPSSCP